MKLSFNVYSNLNNGAGLERDWHLLYKILTLAGHEVFGVDIGRWKQMPRNADINIFLEIIDVAMLEPGVAKKNWLIPNSEWWPGPGYQQPDNWNNYLGRFDKILCKTIDCFNIWSKKVPREKCVYIGWEARDMQQSVRKYPHFLHLAGKSETKNTAAVMDAWRQHRLPYPITVSAFKPEIVRLCQNVANVRLVNRFSDDEVIQQMNEHEFHIMPSKYEGFGHAIHEALSCGGIVITTDAPPMNQFAGIPSDLLIPVERREVRGPAFFNIVSANSIADKVRAAVNIPPHRRAAMSRIAREGFVADREFFRTAMTEVLRATGL